MLVRMSLVIAGRKSPHPPFRKGGFGGIGAIFSARGRGKTIVPYE